MSTYTQIHPKTGKPIRQVRVIAADSESAWVVALNGPMRGSHYDVTPSQLRPKPPVVGTMPTAS